MTEEQEFLQNLYEAINRREIEPSQTEPKQTESKQTMNPVYTSDSEPIVEANSEISETSSSTPPPETIEASADKLTISPRAVMRRMKKPIPKLRKRPNPKKPLTIDDILNDQ